MAPWKGNDFQHDRGEAIAAMTSGLYGTEHDERMDEIVDVENGARKFWADRLRERAEEGPHDERAGMLRAASLLDPYTPKTAADDSFSRTRLDDQPEGARWVYPEA
jgi:hypothetical protein